MHQNHPGSVPVQHSDVKSKDLHLKKQPMYVLTQGPDPSEKHSKTSVPDLSDQKNCPGYLADLQIPRPIPDPQNPKLRESGSLGNSFKAVILSPGCI